MAGGGKEVGMSDGELKGGGSCTDLPVKVMNSPAESSHVEETGHGSVPNASSNFNCDNINVSNLGGREMSNEFLEEVRVLFGPGGQTHFFLIVSFI